MTCRPLNAIAVVFSFLVLTTLVGCTSWEVPSMPTDASWLGIKPKPQIPNEMTDIWEETMVRGPDGAKRAFGGRVMFFAKGEKKPVPVDGTLTVYAFRDDDSDSPTSSKPLKKFVFPAENLEHRHNKTELGHSYDFLLKWDDLGGVEERLVIQCRFDPIGGGPVMSAPSRRTLPGRPSEAPQLSITEKESKADRSVVPVSYEEPAEPTKPKMKTDTIEIDSSFTRHLHGAEQPPRPSLLNHGPSASDSPLRLPTSSEAAREGPAPDDQT